MTRAALPHHCHCEPQRSNPFFVIARSPLGDRGNLGRSPQPYSGIATPAFSGLAMTKYKHCHCEEPKATKQSRANRVSSLKRRRIFFEFGRSPQPYNGIATSYCGRTRNDKRKGCHCEERSKKILSSFQRFAPCEIKDFLRGSRERRSNPPFIVIARAKPEAISSEQGELVEKKTHLL